MKTTYYLIGLIFLSGCASDGLNLFDVDPAAIPAAPTYAENIQPMIDYYCVACHDPARDPAAGIELTLYDDVVGNYDDIAKTIFEERSMPPGGARRLTSQEELILARWAAQGFAE